VEFCGAQLNPINCPLGERDWKLELPVAPNFFNNLGGFGKGVFLFLDGLHLLKL